MPFQHNVSALRWPLGARRSLGYKMCVCGSKALTHQMAERLPPSHRMLLCFQLVFLTATTMTDYQRLLSSLDPLLGSNQPPLPQQNSDIASLIGHFAEELDGVESRIASLQNELSQLHSSKVALQKDIKKYSSILSAVRSIPPEIIRTFMLNCYGDGGGFFQDDVLNLALVSRQWYQVAVSIPQLWSSYSVELRSTPPESTTGTVDTSASDGVTAISHVSSHFAKALSLTLSLNLNIDASVLGDAVCAFIHNLAPRLDYLRIYLHTEEEEQVDLVLARLLGRTIMWPVLRVLDINLSMGRNYDFDWSGDVFTGPTNRFPAIIHLALEQYGEEYKGRLGTLKDWNMPWSQLRGMNLGPFPLLDAQLILNVLSECTRLQECTIAIGRCFEYLGRDIADTTCRSKPIKLRKLTNFRLSTEHERVSKCILDRLSLPALQRLSYSLNKKEGFDTPNWCVLDSKEEKAIDSILSPVTDLIKRSSCGETLVELALELGTGLSVIYYIPDNIEDLFAEVPRLKRFKASGSVGFPSELLTSLPISVERLELELEDRRLNSDRRDFAVFLRDHCKARQSANGGTPQEFNGTFRLVETDSLQYTNWLMRSLAEREFKCAAKLHATMD